MTRAAVYARCSPGTQSERFLYLQVLRCQERAQRDGCTSVEVFTDRAVTNSATTRSGLEALLARAGEFDVVISESPDRFTRDSGEMDVISQQILDAGARIITLSDGPYVDPRDEAGR